MRYFFYDYRAHQIETLVREVAEHVRKINPKIQTSAAVFKNPILSGRFLTADGGTLLDYTIAFNPVIPGFAPVVAKQLTAALTKGLPRLVP